MATLEYNVTFGEFARLAKQNGLTSDGLVEIVKPWWEGRDPKEQFAKRVFTPLYAQVIIPYRSLLLLYASWKEIREVEANKTCACGCGKPINSAFRRYASEACKQRHFRKGHEPTF